MCLSMILIPLCTRNSKRQQQVATGGNRRQKAATVQKRHILLTAPSHMECILAIVCCCRSLALSLPLSLSLSLFLPCSFAKAMLFPVAISAAGIVARQIGSDAVTVQWFCCWGLGRSAAWRCSGCGAAKVICILCGFVATNVRPVKAGVSSSTRQVNTSVESVWFIWRGMRDLLHLPRLTRRSRKISSGC